MPREAAMHRATAELARLATPGQEAAAQLETLAPAARLPAKAASLEPTAHPRIAPCLLTVSWCPRAAAAIAALRCAGMPSQ